MRDNSSNCAETNGNNIDLFNSVRHFIPFFISNCAVAVAVALLISNQMIPIVVVVVLTLRIASTYCMIV